MSEENQPGGSPYPSGDELTSQISKRHRYGALWRTLFLVATVTAVIVLTVLLLTIINQSFGLTAVQEDTPEKVLVQQYFIEQITSSPNVEGSEDDQKLADNIGSVADSTGFFGYAFYTNNTDKLKALSVEGVAPTQETANSGEYPLTRPLYIYTTEEILAQKPQVASFVNFYMDSLDEVIPGIGYFTADSESLAESNQTVQEILGEAGAQPLSPSDVTGTIVAVGSSTVFPVTGAVAELFKKAGFQDNVDLDSIGTIRWLQRLLFRSQRRRSEHRYRQCQPAS